MNPSTVLSRATRSSITVSKTITRSFYCGPVKMFKNQEPQQQFEKTHHQVAPLTDSTLYAPQGHISASNTSTTTSSSSHNDTTVFTPSVNSVFDD